MEGKQNKTKQKHSQTTLSFVGIPCVWISNKLAPVVFIPYVLTNPRSFSQTSTPTLIKIIF